MARRDFGDAFRPKAPLSGGLFSETFQNKLGDVHNPYGEGGASEKIVQTLKDIKLEFILKKSFNDL